MLAKFLFVALGGALGAMSRYAISLLLPYKAGFPYATFMANLMGSLVIGLAYTLIVERALVTAHYRELLIVGFLGALTTFSTFSLEVVLMIQNYQLSIACLYVVTSLIFCIVAAFLGIGLGRYI